MYDSPVPTVRGITVDGADMERVLLEVVLYLSPLCPDVPDVPDVPVVPAVPDVPFTTYDMADLYVVAKAPFPTIQVTPNM